METVETEIDKIADKVVQGMAAVFVGHLVPSKRNIKELRICLVFTDAHDVEILWRVGRQGVTRNAFD